MTYPFSAYNKNKRGNQMEDKSEFNGEPCKLSRKEMVGMIKRLDIFKAHKCAGNYKDWWYRVYPSGDVKVECKKCSK